jgi:hypothetical protein
MSDVLNSSVYDLSNLTAVLGAVNASNQTLLDVFDNAHGITLFAPNDTAISTTQCCVGGLLPNTTALLALLGNHVCLLIQFIILGFTLDSGY